MTICWFWRWLKRSYLGLRHLNNFIGAFQPEKKELLSNEDHKTEQIFWNRYYRLQHSLFIYKPWILSFICSSRFSRALVLLFHLKWKFVISLFFCQLGNCLYVIMFDQGWIKSRFFRNCLVWILEMSKLLRFSPMFDCQWWCFIA